MQRVIAYEHHAGARRRGQPLMGINDDRVGLFNAIEERGDARIESAEKSISAIDLRPDFAPARDSRLLITPFLLINVAPRTAGV